MKTIIVKIQNSMPERVDILPENAIFVGQIDVFWNPENGATYMREEVVSDLGEILDNEQST